MAQSLPKILIDRLASFLGEEDFNSVMHAFGSERAAAFRINPLKSWVKEVEESLHAKGIRFESVPGVENAYIVPKSDEYALKGTDLFYDGKIYVQGLSSQLPTHFLDLVPGMRVLDVCAAPGSKTTQIGAIMKNTGQIIALEKHQIRFDKLAHNCRLQGLTNVVLEKTDALEYLARNEGLFDAILLDAPCSAEGRIQLSDERTFGFWSLENTVRKAEIQTEILTAALFRLAPGWVLVYATCTLAPEENEGVVTAALSAETGVKLQACEWNITEARKGLTEFAGNTFASGMEKTLRILPSERTEGFFIAKFKKEE